MEQVACKLDLEGWVGFQQADVRVGVCSGNVKWSGVTGSQSTWWETEEMCLKLHDEGPPLLEAWGFPFYLANSGSVSRNVS